MEFFPALVIIGGLRLCELTSVFALNSRTLEYNMRVLIGLISAAFGVILFIVLCQGMGWWAVAWLVGTHQLAKALWYNHDGCRPLANKDN